MTKKSSLYALPFLTLALVAGCGRNAAKEASTPPQEPPKAEAPKEPAPAQPQAEPQKSAEAPPVTVEEKAPPSKSTRKHAAKSTSREPREKQDRVTQPVELTRVQPTYPELAKRMKI